MENSDCKPLTVEELRERLHSCEGPTHVYLARDEEGNAYSRACEIVEAEGLEGALSALVVTQSNWQSGKTKQGVRCMRTNQI